MKISVVIDIPDEDAIDRRLFVEDQRSADLVRTPIITDWRNWLEAQKRLLGTQVTNAGTPPNSADGEIAPVGSTTK